MIKSVNYAPLTLILVKASCPGVSINVTLLPPSVFTWKAPIFYVIPPNSDYAIELYLSESSRVVLP